MNFVSDAIAEIEGLLDVNQDFCKKQMAQKACSAAPLNCAVLPLQRSRQMKLISWNVNGIRAVMGKGFMESFQTLDADVFCLQETKVQPGQITLDLPGYHQYLSLIHI